MDIKDKFIDGLSTLYAEHFTRVKTDSISPELMNRIQGYIKAGEVMNLFTQEQALLLMEDAHFAVFGESITQRKTRKNERKIAYQNNDDDYFDIPPSLR